MPKKCHFINDKEAGRVLIPGCMGTAVYYDISFCTCKNPPSIEQRVSKLEKENARLRKRLNEIEKQCQ